MALNIGSSTIGGDSTTVKQITEAIRIDLIEAAKEVANTNLDALVDKVDTMWVGVTADQFKEKIKADKKKFGQIMDLLYEEVEQDIKQMEANVVNADSYVAANMGDNGGGGGTGSSGHGPSAPTAPTQPEQPSAPEQPTAPQQPTQPQQPSTPPSEDDILKIISDEPTEEPVTPGGGSGEPQLPDDFEERYKKDIEDMMGGGEGTKPEDTKPGTGESEPGNPTPTEEEKKAAEEEAAKKAAEEEAAKKAAEEEAAKKAEEEQKAKEEEERKAKEEEERKAKEEEERKAKEEEERKAKEEEERKAKEEEERKAKEEEERKAKEEEEKKKAEEEAKKKEEEEAAKKAAEEEAAKKAAEEEAAKKAAEEEAAKKAEEEAQKEQEKKKDDVTVPYGDEPIENKLTSSEKAAEYNDEVYKSLNGHDYSAKSNGGTGHCGEQARVVLQKMGVMNADYGEFSNGKGFASKLTSSDLNGYDAIQHKTNASNQRDVFDSIISNNGGSTGPLVISFDQGGHYGDPNGHVVVVTGVSQGMVYAIDSSDANWNSGTTKIAMTVDQFKDHYFSSGSQAPGPTQANCITEIK